MLDYDSENNIFNLNSQILYAQSKIKFSLAYLYSSKYKSQLNNDEVDYDCTLISLEDNNSKKPEIKQEKNKLIVKIPNNEGENTIINFFLKIYFSSTFYINIKFNSKIYPFDFNFKWFSYNKKKFVSEDIIIYINKEKIPMDYTLFLKIEKISKSAFTEYQKDYYLPPEIRLINTNFEEKKNKKEFVFKVDLRIIERPIIKDYYIKVMGNQVEKILRIKPMVINGCTNLIKDLYDLPKYKYSFENKVLLEESEINKYSIYITPFNYYIPCIFNIYSNKKNELELSEQISEYNEDSFILSFNMKKNCFVKIKFGEIYNSSDIIKIIYILNEDIWFPKKKMEREGIRDIFKYFNYLKYEYNSIKLGIERLNKINNDNDYWHIPRIILQNNNIKEIKDNFLKYIPLFPSSLINELKKEIDLLNVNLEEDYLPIFQNNLIYIIYNQMLKKYEEIKKNNNILFLTKEKPNRDIQNKIKEKNSEYFTINEEILRDEDDSAREEIEIKDKKDGHNIYLLNENKIPEALDGLGQIPLEEKEEIKMKNTKSENFDLSDIPINELNRPKSTSINEIIKYYNNCNKIINILYFYIISASKSNNKKNKIEAGNYFQKLESIQIKFNQIGIVNDYSFFSLDINEFLNEFYCLQKKLKDIGYKRGKSDVLPRKNNEENYITFPKKKGIYKDNDNWASEKIGGNNAFRHEEAQVGRVRANRLYNENLGESFYEENDSENEDENKFIKNESKNIINEELDIEKIKVIDVEDNRFDDIYENENEVSKIEDDDILSEKENKVKVGKITDNLVSIEPTSINEKNFKEEDGIKRALKILELEKSKKDSNSEQKLDLGNPKKYHKFNDMNIFYLDKNVKLNIQPLYNKASFLANQLFIKINGNGKIKYSDTLVILLIDPSVYISEEIKALNMFIICAMTNALNCLEIKYSIVLMGDEEFRCVIKDYNEPHSLEALERVYECLILKRFRTNIPACLRYCIEEVSSKSNFKYTSFFIFTDGLDKSFIYTQKNTWDAYIFHKRYNSFGFIFLFSSVLKSKNKEFLNEIWTTFLNESKKNSRSSIFLKSLELRIDDDFKKKINEIFISNFIRPRNEETINEIKYIKPLFKVKNEYPISSFLKNSDKVFDDKSLFKLSGSFIKNDIIPSSLNTNKEPLDINYFKNNLHQIAKKINDKINEQENSIYNFAHKFLSIRTILNRGILEEIFKPNKANLKVLSNIGTEIDIMALILYFLNPVPDPMIYLQDAIGNVKEYSITVIIDTSISVLNHINFNHSLNIIRVLLSSFTIIDLPSFDLIVTGEEGPIVLCSEYPSFAALNEKSKLWELLCQCLSNPIYNADLLSCLQTAFDLKRMRSNNFPSFLFVLTDGLFEEDKQNQLKENIAKLVQTNIQVIGIGLGIYPYGINYIFGQAIFDINPNNLPQSILSILEGNINDKREMHYIQNEEESEKNISIAISRLNQSKKNNYKLLTDELKQSPLTTNCYDMINEEINGGSDEFGRLLNPKGDKIGLLKENSLSGQKILIVMLWSCALSEVENKLLDPKNIGRINELNSKCIKSTVDYLGVKVKTVLNYEDAIKELTKKDENGKCNYYTTWVMCGPDINELPDKSKYPGLVEQFIDCLILYWNNGGSVVLFCDNDPLIHYIFKLICF